jgi:hypothetical protein
MRDSTEKVAIITAISGIIVAVITGLFMLMSKHTDSVVNKPNTSGTPSSTPQSFASKSPDMANPVNTNQSVGDVPNQRYEIVAEVGEDKSYIDPETGFVYAVEEITDLRGTRGAFSNYTLPDGTFQSNRMWPIGYRVNFNYRGRKFFMVIEDIDNQRKVAKIRIKEF